MDFTNFKLEIFASQGQWQVKASCPTAGEGEIKETFLPFSPEDFSRELARFGLSSEQDREETKRGPLADLSSSEIGSKLFQALFQGEVLVCYERALQESGGRLRIVLEMDAQEDDFATFASLPWELMRDDQTGIYPALQQGSGIVRQTGVNRPFQVKPLLLPLKVLLVLPEVVDPELGDTRVVDFINQFRAIDWGGKVELDLLEKPTLRSLGKAVLKPYHVIHFTAHAGWMEHSRQYGIVMENEDGGKDPVSAEDLAIALEPALGHLRLVTLMACSSSRTEKNGSRTPFSGLATHLLQTGVPAVIGTQFSITVNAALTFSEACYEHLALGHNLMLATNEGRRAIHQEMRSLEWLVPVLYSRLEDDRLFDPSPRLFINNFSSQLDLVKLLRENKYTEVLDVYPYFKGERSADWPTLYKRFWALQNSMDSHQPVLIEGKARLSIFLALGYVLSQPSRFQLYYRQWNENTEREELWSTRVEGEPERRLTEKEPGTPGAPDLVVTLSVSALVEPQATALIRKEISFGSWLHLASFDVGRKAIENGRDSAKLARDIAQDIRDLGQQYEKVHLFLAAPSAFALVLGHYLNACGKIQVYEHQNQGYAPSFLLGGEW